MYNAEQVRKMLQIFNIKNLTYRISKNTLIALMISFALGFSFQSFGQSLLMLQLNFLAIPLFFVFSLELWMYYVIVITWVLDILILPNLSVPKIPKIPTPTENSQKSFKDIMEEVDLDDVFEDMYGE